MRTRSRAFVGILVLVLALAGWGESASAQGTTTIYLSKNNPVVGDSLTVRVQASESGTVTVKYNSSVLQLQSCDVEGYRVDGNKVTYTAQVANLVFQSIAEGKSSMIVSSDTLKGSSLSIPVRAGAADTQTEEPQQDNQQAAPDNGSAGNDASGQFTIDGTAYVVSERFADREIPKGFQRTEIKINDKTYKQLSNGTEVLLYLKPAANTAGKGSFYLYQETDASVTPAVLLGTTDDYVLVLHTAEPLDASWVSTSVELDGKQLDVYVLNEEEKEFCFLYGLNGEGTRQWYQYDMTAGTIQRFNQSFLPQESVQEDPAPVDDGKPSPHANRLRYVVAALILVIVVLVIIVLNVMLGRRRDEEDEDVEEFDDEEFYDEDFEEFAEDEEDEFDEAEDLVKQRRADDIEKETPKEAPQKERREVVSKEEKSADTAEEEQQPKAASADIEDIKIMDFNDL